MPSCQSPSPHRRQTRTTRGVRGQGGQGQERQKKRGMQEAGHGGEEQQDPPPPRRREVRQEATENGEETGPAVEEEEREGRDTDGETPRRAMGDVIRVGGVAPPQRKSRIYLTSPLNVCTCCCRESMETYLTTIMGRTWTGESRTTLYVCAVGAG